MISLSDIQIMYVYVGNDRFQSGQMIQVKLFIKHPSYLRSDPLWTRTKYNIGLIKLEEKIQMEKDSKRFLTNSICLPKPNLTRNTKLENGTFYGWGVINDKK